MCKTNTFTDLSNHVWNFVVDESGYECDEECPSCGKQATRRDFDECLGGAVNSVYSINCHHCGYHECSKEVCSTCEQKYEDERWVYELQVKADLVIEDLVDQLEGGAVYISPVDVTFLKLLIGACRKSSTVYDMNFVERGGISKVKRSLLDARFTGKLALKIAQAEMGLA